MTVLLLFFSIMGCADQKKKDEEQIRETVHKFWTAVQNNDEEGYLALIDNSKEYRLSMLDQLHYLNRNYHKIEKEIQAQGVQIKDTNELGPSQKAVEYLFTKPHTAVEPLTVKLFFYQPIGYHTVLNIRILGNMPEWEK